MGKRNVNAAPVRIKKAAVLTPPESKPDSLGKGGIKKLISIGI